jgi:hypothetical protein
MTRSTSSIHRPRAGILLAAPGAAGTDLDKFKTPSLRKKIS